MATESRLPSLDERFKRIVKRVHEALAEAVALVLSNGDWNRAMHRLRDAERSIDQLRFYAVGLRFDRRPDRLVMRSRQMARTIVEWSDELDGTTSPAQRRLLQERLEALAVPYARAHRSRYTGTDTSFLRSLLCDSVTEVADLARTGKWKNLVPRTPSERWVVLADEIIAGFGMHRAFALRLRKHRALLEEAIEKCSTNLGGRGKRSVRPKSQVLQELCAAVGLGNAELKSVHRAKRRSK